MSPGNCHLSGKTLVSGYPDPLDAGRPVGIQDYPNHFGNEGIVFFAGRQFGSGAVGTTLQIVFPAAIPDCTPAGLLIFGTPRAFTGEIGAAGTAVETARCDQVDIGDDFFRLGCFHWQSN